MKNPFKKGHCYKVQDNHLSMTYTAIYMGREEGYPCMICGKGNNAHGFNVYQGESENPNKAQVEDYIDNDGYETFFYGTEHLPEIIEEVF